MAKEKFIDVLDALCEEKGIDRETFLEMLKESIAKSYKKTYLDGEGEVRVEINEKTGKFKLFELRTVVDDVENENEQLSLEEAQEIKKKYKLGDVVETEADVNHISRLAAIQTKQLFRQKIRETEKEALYNEFADKQDEIVTGIVDRVEDKFAIVNIGKTGAFLAGNQMIPGEKLTEGEHLKVYVSEVDKGTKGTHIVVTRTNPGFVKRLFEIEVPEVYDGTVEIKSVAREPGDRSKIAVYSSNENVDARGACIGQKGARVRNVVDELNGEMIDVIEYSSDPIVYISNALSPSDVELVDLDKEKKAALVVVPDDQLSLAIGKKGQNARLAVKLTGWNIDIKSVTEAKEQGIDIDAKLNEQEVKEEIPVDNDFEESFAKEMIDEQPQNDEELMEEFKAGLEKEFAKEDTNKPTVEDDEDDQPISGSLAAVEAEEKNTEVKETESVEEVEEDTDSKEIEETEETVESDESNEEFEDFEDEEDEEYDSKYDEDIDYDEYDKYYDED
ncbi:MAG: transcription termination factor NusA [Thomasclavelia sp.]|jgi:N utilization substance protein A|nr:transcription termination factor NusA [Thomasclavelia sp.]